MQSRVIYLLCAILWTSIAGSGEQISVDNAPRIVTNNGNLVFQAGSSKTIQFETQGNGDIKFNDIDFRDFYGQMRDIKTLITQNQINNNNYNNNRCDCNAMKLTISSNTQKIKNLKAKLKIATEQIKTISVLVNDLKQISTIDECSNNPCHHGGTCIDGFGKFKCICTERYKGLNCLEDVNECSQLAGTDLGCQNNARCENYEGGFRCICSGKWSGVLCNIPTNGCIGSSNSELCGHGTCVSDHTVENVRSFKCICDHGWSLDQLTKTCILDINECEVGRYPCSQSPNVPCYNTPGSFTCGQCPTGYNGNGFSCLDINECLNPRICGINQLCINTQGSYQCQCVEGMTFNQNGVCHREDICQIDNGGCNLNAQCTRNSFYAEGRICICNTGYIGNGVGSNGCVLAPVTNTTNSAYRRCVRRQLCRNGGSCQLTTAGFICQCAQFFTGERCRTQIINKCLQNPCQNGGTCEFLEPNNYRCTCKPSFYGRNCETEQTECGGTIISPRNERDINFFVPTTTTSSYIYPCVWTVLVSDEQFIQVKPITLRWSGSCSQEYVQIFEKSSSESELHELGKYCRESTQASSIGYNTTGSILIVKAVLQNNIQEQHGFLLRITPFNYITQSVDCCRCLNGQHVLTEKSNGLFQSPHYPLAYPEGTDCIIQYERTFGERYKVVLSLNTVDLGDSNGNCSDTDYLKIFYAERGEIKITACNQQSFQNQRFLTSGFKVQFHSDSRNSPNPSRFQIIWRKTSNEDPCGDILSFQNSGSIQVPSLLESQEAYCTWNVHQSNVSQMISLKGVFNNWRNGDCSVYLKIINVNLDGTSRILWDQCQNSVMLEEITEEITGKLIIIFKKSMGVNTPSFNIKATYICGKVINMDLLTEFELKSPNYPNNYDINLNCTFRFVAKTRKFSISFEDFDITDEYPCLSDYIEIKGASRSFINGKYCNGNSDLLSPVDKELSSENLIISFITNSSLSGRGFKAKVTLFDCGGSYYLLGSLVIAYPDDHINQTNLNIQYESNKNCVWNILSPPGSYILTVFDHFHLEYHYDCRYDSLSVSYDNVTDKKFCGNDIVNIMTKSNRLKLVFKSDHSVSGEGFIMRAYVGSMETYCHQEVVASEGRIISHPVGSISRPYLCIYSIIVPLGRKVVINITIDGFTERNETYKNVNQCFGKGRLRIKNGQIGSVSMTEVCPQSPQKGLITTSSNKAYILYLVPSYRSAFEFNFTIWFRSIDEECGSIHNDDFGDIASPNYPLYAPINTYCQWEIHSTPGHEIKIRIIHIKAGSTSNTRNCDDSKKPIIKFISLSKEISISCEKHTEEIYQFSDKVVRVIFKNYQSTQYRFRLSYKKVCIISTNASFGTIESNNLMTYYPNYCSWKINILRGSTLVLQFDQFDLPNPINGICKTYVEISDSKKTILAKSCGGTLINNTFQTSDSPIIIKHYINPRTPFNILKAHRGFILEYNTRGCVYKFNYDPNRLIYFDQSASGSFSSPDYPNSISNTDCIWTFKTIPGYSVKLKFHIIELDSFYNCSEGYILKARDSENINDPFVFQSCERVTESNPLIFQSSTNYLYLIFSSANDPNGGRRKFQATYEFINTSCEYQITAAEGIIKSPNYPGDYPININCKWYLSVRQGMSIHLHFVDFQIEGSSCRYDYVQLFSSFNSEMMPMTRLCGDNINSSTIFQSINNEMLITLKTDSSVQRRGFKAKFFEGCGGQRNATEINQFLLSPNYPNNYILSDNVCEWTIIANISEPGEKIFFYFLGFEGDTANQNSNCTLNTNTLSDNSLTIVDGLEDTPIKATLCSSEPTPQIISSGHFLRIILKSTNGKAIFKAGYSTGNSACGGEYFLDNGIFTSPFYPNAVNMDMDCTYMINVVQGSQMDLTIVEFSRTNDNAYELHDFIEIRMGNAETNSLVGRFYTLSDIQNATKNVKFNNSVLIRFRSQGGSYTNAVKFLAIYHINYLTEFQSDEGSLASPQFGHLYKDDTSITWTINPITTQSISIQFFSFSVGRRIQNDDCDRGKLMITDGNGESKSLCGSNLPSTETYSAPVVLTLVAEGYRYQGFLLNWSIPVNESFIKIGNCNYVITATDMPQILTSPNFPNFDPIHRDCQWTIVAPSDGAIDLQMLNFSLENSRNCKYENFTISIKKFRLMAINTYRRYENIDRTFCGQQNSSLLNYTNDMIFTSVLIKFQVDKLDIFPGFKLQYKLKCYKMLKSIEGWLQNKEFPNYITDLKNCTYVFRTIRNRNYVLNVTSLSLPPQTNGECLDGYLEIYTRKKIGRYCGSNIPINLKPLLTNSSFVFIKLVGAFNRYSTYSGFQLKYSLEEVEECGGRHTLLLNTDLITISNPRNGSSSPHFVECKWYIFSPYGTTIKIDIPDLNIFSYNECEDSFLSFYDGSTTLSRKIGEKNYCHKESSLLTSGNKLLIFFRNLDHYAKFQIQVSIGFCGGILYKSSGIITSPNYPHGYSKPVNCMWTIGAGIAHFFIRFDEFNLNNNCTSNNLTIFTQENPPAFKWSNCVNQTTTISIITNIIKIEFTANQILRERGFKLSYKSRVAECGGTFSDPSGELMSINYPASMPRYLSCYWKIETDITKRLTIKIKKLTLKRSCLSIYNGRFTLIQYICRKNLENLEIDTKSSSVLIFLGSDGNTRILLSYHTDQPSLCGRHFYPGSNDTGLITFAGNLSYCQHIVHNYPEDVGTITFKGQNISLLNCRFEQLTFQSNINRDNGLSSVVDYLEVCNVANLNKNVFTTMGKSVSVVHHSSRKLNQSNHRISLMYKYQRCGGVLTEPFGYVTSPNYPNKYPHNSNCEWVIKAQDDMHIKLVINSLHLEQHSFCSYDHLIIRSGPEFDSPPMNTFCGKRNITNETIIFQNNLLRLSFRSDLSAAENGFSIQYYFINAVDNCNGFIFNDTGSVQSPNYPRPYPGNTRCNWTIILPQGYQVQLTVKEPFDLEIGRSNVCQYDALEIIDSNPDIVIKRLCGHIAPTRPIVSSENRVGIYFSTDHNLNLGGFRITYKPVCGGTFNGTIGIINSPKIYIMSSRMTTCNYTIPSWKNHLTVLTIIPSLNFCGFPNGNIEIWKQIQGGSFVFSQNICGKNELLIKVFNTFGIMIKYNMTYRGTNKYSFKGNYLHEETVKVYKNFTKQTRIQTPSFPTPYHHNADLKWKFESPSNYIFHIQILAMDIESGSFGCIYDYVAFYSGNNTNSSNLVEKLCGKRLFPFKVESNNMMIHFISDSSHYINHTGFIAKIIASPGPKLGCGGILELQPNSVGFISSPDLNNDGNYENGLLCEWKLLAPNAYSIKLRFENNSVAMERRTYLTCHYDWLKIFDGLYQGSPLLHTLCGNDTVDPLISSSSNFLILLQTDNSITNRGFKIYYSTIRSLNNIYLNATSDFQSLVSPNYPENTVYNFKSRIEISAPNETDHILVEIKELFIRPTSNCSLDSLLIRDVSLRYQNQFRRFCKPNQFSIPFISSDSKVFLLYTIGAQEDQNNLPILRYKIDYKIYNCNRTEQAYSGRIINIEALKQNTYLHNTICNLTLKAPSPNLSYQFYFKRLLLEESATCAYDYIQFTFGRLNEQQYTLPRICGRYLPPSLISNSSFVSIKFVTDHSVAMEGFDITYVVNQDPNQRCGGDIDLDSGVITSPGFGRNIYESGSCIWNIASISRNNLFLKITDLQLGPISSIGALCTSTTDYLQITASENAQKFCGNIPPLQVLSIRKNRITVEYKSVNGGTGLGFRLEWTSTEEILSI